jgi:hypothetical protein
MKVTSLNDIIILEQIHRKFSEIATLFDELSEQTKNQTLDFHDENYSINHCIRWGEIAISEIRDEIEK